MRTKIDFNENESNWTGQLKCRNNDDTFVNHSVMEMDKEIPFILYGAQMTDKSIIKTERNILLNGENGESQRYSFILSLKSYFGISINRNGFQ